MTKSPNCRNRDSIPPQSAPYVLVVLLCYNNKRPNCASKSNSLNIYQLYIRDPATTRAATPDNSTDDGLWMAQRVKWVLVCRLVWYIYVNAVDKVNATYNISIKWLSDADATLTHGQRLSWVEQGSFQLPTTDQRRLIDDFRMEPICSLLCWMFWILEDCNWR